MNDAAQPPSPPVKATVRRGWWPGWIWAVPIAALLVVGWLGLRALTRGGQSITIVFDDAHGLKEKNAHVVYRGMNVGSVTGVALSNDARTVKVSADIDQSAVQFLRSGTRFWLKGARPSIGDLSSLSSVLSGPTVEMEPGPGTQTTHFQGIGHKPLAPVGAGPPQQYSILFAGAVGALHVGDPVKLRGFTVGEVEDVGFQFDAATSALRTPVTIGLFASLFHIQSGPDHEQLPLRAVVTTLVKQGLRAQLERDPPFIGSYSVALQVVPNAPAATLVDANGMPQIPTAPGGGLDSILTRINKVPIDQIAQNVDDITHHLDTIVASPKLDDAVTQLESAVAQLHDTIAQAGPQVTQLVETLRNAADQLDQAAKSVGKIAGGPATQNGVGSTLRKIAEAATSVRELADFLDRHPEALIHGRSGE